MKFNWKAGLGCSLYVGCVYLIGSYLGYRVGKTQGKIEAHIESIESTMSIPNELKK